MIKPITPLKDDYLTAGLDRYHMLLLAVLDLRDRMKEVTEHINGEPERLEELIDVSVARKLTQVKADPNCKLCFGTGITGNHDGRLGNLCDCTKQDEKNEKCNHPDHMFCNECDEWIKPAGDVCKAHLTWKETAYNSKGQALDNTDAAYEPFDSRAYNIKLWTRDMRKMIKGKNISPKLKDDIRRKLNELEEL